ncbi:hypothetical protein RhiirA4_429452 [Rhizophagus irregularis]|uniref:Uncharacterized protein n=1 Tax=Rhizophagus irregularis TaxID=588596 RepID=A0A2I1HGR9_9GLOM|nr:hypothetical protein RhiirA4_429452 [Rhizophagus irregularis]
MTSLCDVSALSREEVLAKLREVADLCAKCTLKQETLLVRFNSLPDGSPAKARAYLNFGPLRQLETADSENDIASPPNNDQPSHDEPVIDDLPPSPLTIWASNHEADPNIILDLCTPSLQRTNRSSRIRRVPKFLCKRVSSMISPASFKRAQKIKKNLSFTRLVLSSSTIRLLVPPVLIIPDTNDDNTTSQNPVALDVTDDFIVFSPTFVLSNGPGDTLSSISASSTFPHDKESDPPYTFTLRTILDGRIQPRRNVGSNRLYSIRRGNCYFLLDPTPDLDNCYTIHTNSRFLFTSEPFPFISDRSSLNQKFILSKFLTFFFHRQSSVPSRARRKYFARLRQLLLTQRVTSLARWSSSLPNNKRTRTFIQFRYRQSCFYLGLYFGCPFCKTPAAYVMSRFRHACHIHDMKLIQTPSPPPRSPFVLPYSSMWVATKDPPVIIPPSSYKLTLSTTDPSIILSVRRLISSRPDVSFSMVERSHKSSIAFVSSNFTGSVQKVVLNPSAIVTEYFTLNKPTSGPFVGPNCPVVDYDHFKALGLTRPIINIVQRILSTSASLYVPSHNFLWIIISKHNTSSISQKRLRNAVHSIITASARSSTSSHL